MFENPGPFKFGRSSTRELETLKEPLKTLLNKAIEMYDFSVVEGARTIETQIQNIRRGASRTVDSRHIPRDEAGNYLPDGPGEAADLVPFQAGISAFPQVEDTPAVREKKLRRFYFMQGILYAVARYEEIDIRSGVDWDSDLDFFDQTFDDMGHVELRLPRAPLRIPEEMMDEVNEVLRHAGLPVVGSDKGGED